MLTIVSYQDLPTPKIWGTSTSLAFIETAMDFHVIYTPLSYVTGLINSLAGIGRVQITED